MCGDMSYYVIYNKNICHFWDPHRARLPLKIESTRIYTNDATLRYGFFPENALSDRPVF